MLLSVSVYSKVSEALKSGSLHTFYRRRRQRCGHGITQEEIRTYHERQRQTCEISLLFRVFLFLFFGHVLFNFHPLRKVGTRKIGFALQYAGFNWTYARPVEARPRQLFDLGLIAGVAKDPATNKFKATVIFSFPPQVSAHYAEFSKE